MKDDGASTKINSEPQLRRGWTTGACATAAAKAAFRSLIGHDFPDPVQITLPGGEKPSFALAITEIGDGFARAGVVKDAGDDPDVTHGALIVATVRRGLPGSGVRYAAGPGVGTVTRPGLPLAVGEPAINPVPRAMIATAIGEVAAEYAVAADVEVEISIPHGEEIAQRTLNGRLGILGGLSVLGTTGIVIPFSCSAWIHSIHRGIDVARAMGLTHVAGSTGNTTEKAVQALHELDEVALIDMGDFVGGMLKYLRVHPVERVTVAGGIAKMVKLAQGLADLHSKRGSVDHAFLAGVAAKAGASEAVVERVRGANTALEVLEIARDGGFDIGTPIAEAAWTTAAALLREAPIALEVVVFDRQGGLVATTGFRPVAGRG